MLWGKSSKILQLDKGSQWKDVMFDGMPAVLTATVVSNSLRSVDRGMLLGDIAAPDDWPRPNNVMVRATLRQPNHRRPDMIIYWTAWPKRYWQNRDGREERHSSEWFYSRWSRIDPLFDYIRQNWAQCEQSWWTKADINSRRKLGLHVTSHCLVCARGKGDLADYVQCMSRYDPELDSEWATAARLIDHVIDDLFPHRPDLTKLHQGDLLLQSDDLPSIRAMGLDGAKAGKTAGGNDGETAGLHDVESQRIQREGRVDDDTILEARANARRRLTPDGLEDLVDAVRATAPVSTLENRDKIVSELEELIANLNALDDRAKREADLIMRLQSANRMLKTIADPVPHHWLTSDAT